MGTLWRCIISHSVAQVCIIKGVSYIIDNQEFLMQKKFLDKVGDNGKKLKVVKKGGSQNRGSATY